MGIVASLRFSSITLSFLEAIPGGFHGNETAMGAVKPGLRLATTFKSIEPLRTMGTWGFDDLDRAWCLPGVTATASELDKASPEWDVVLVEYQFGGRVELARNRRRLSAQLEVVITASVGAAHRSRSGRACVKRTGCRPSCQRRTYHRLRRSRRRAGCRRRAAIAPLKSSPGLNQDRLAISPWESPLPSRWFQRRSDSPGVRSAAWDSPG